MPSQDLLQQIYFILNRMYPTISFVHKCTCIHHCWHTMWCNMYTTKWSLRGQETGTHSCLNIM